VALSAAAAMGSAACNSWWYSRPKIAASNGAITSISSSQWPRPVSRWGQTRRGSSALRVADHCAARLACGLHRSPQRASSVQHSEQIAPW
jgi:hypothetical protein